VGVNLVKMLQKTGTQTTPVVHEVPKCEKIKMLVADDRKRLRIGCKNTLKAATFRVFLSNFSISVGNGFEARRK